MKRTEWAAFCGAAAFLVCPGIRGQAVAQCTPQTCVPLADPICAWNPTASGACKDVVWPTCKCSDYTTPRTCTPVIGSMPLSDAEYYLQGGERPEGLCSQIPCGECYNLEERDCLSLYACQNYSGGTLCSPTVHCAYQYLEDVMKHEYFATGIPCCWDIG